MRIIYLGVIFSVCAENKYSLSYKQSCQSTLRLFKTNKQSSFFLHIHFVYAVRWRQQINHLQHFPVSMQKRHVPQWSRSPPPHTSQLPLYVNAVDKPALFSLPSVCLVFFPPSSPFPCLSGFQTAVSNPKTHGGAPWIWSVLFLKIAHLCFPSG